MNFLRGVFSDNGQPSFSRCASGVIVLSVLVWTSHVIFKTHALPDMGGISLFMSTSVGTLYGTNKLGSMFSNPNKDKV